MKTKLERSLFAVGVALCLFYAGAMIYRAVGSRMALRAFRVAKEHAKTLPSVPSERGAVELPDAAVDVHLWSPKRIAAYKDTLAKQFTPPLAVLRVQKLGIEVPVFEGTDELILNRGAGWIEGTALPGEPGNIGIAGHRDGFFRGLKDIAVGDSLTLEARAGTARYVVSAIKIVDPNDVSVLAGTDTSSLTLVTCYPFYFVGDAPQRYIVQCSLKEGPEINAANARSGGPRSGEEKR